MAPRMLSTMALLALAAAALACASTPPGANPEDMSAEEHRAHAGKHQGQADGAKQSYDPAATVVEQRDDTNFRFGMRTYNPTAGYLEIARQHQAHADAHAAAAATLESFEEAECGDFPPDTRKVCPLLGQVASSEDIEGGVRIVLVEGANAEAVRAHIRCHLKYAAKQGFKGMDQCPLYLKGVSLDEAGEGAVLELKASDAAQIDPLRKRTETHVVR